MITFFHIIYFPISLQHTSIYKYIYITQSQLVTTKKSIKKTDFLKMEIS